MPHFFPSPSTSFLSFPWTHSLATVYFSSSSSKRKCPMLLGLAFILLRDGFFCIQTVTLLRPWECLEPQYRQTSRHQCLFINTPPPTQTDYTHLPSHSWRVTSSLRRMNCYHLDWFGKSLSGGGNWYVAVTRNGSALLPLSLVVDLFLPGQQEACFEIHGSSIIIHEKTDLQC